MNFRWGDPGGPVLARICWKAFGLQCLPGNPGEHWSSGLALGGETHPTRHVTYGNSPLFGPSSLLCHVCSMAWRWIRPKQASAAGLIWYPCSRPEDGKRQNHRVCTIQVNSVDTGVHRFIEQSCGWLRLMTSSLSLLHNFSISTHRFKYLNIYLSTPVVVSGFLQ